MTLHSKGITADGLVRCADNAQYRDAQRADKQGGTCIVVAAEGGDRFIALVDVHGLDYTQVIIERDDGVAVHRREVAWHGIFPGRVLLERRARVRIFCA